MTEEFDDLPELRRRGLERMEEVYGFETRNSSSPYFAYTADHLFADIWNRPWLTDRDRRLMLMGLLAGSGDGDIMKIQMRAALARGELTADALREFVLFISHYAGWPSGAKLHRIAEDVINAQLN